MAKPEFSLATIITQLQTQWGDDPGTFRVWLTPVVTYAMPGVSPDPRHDEDEGFVQVPFDVMPYVRMAFEVWDNLIALDLVENPAAPDIMLSYSTTTSGNGSYTSPFLGGLVDGPVDDTYEIESEQIWFNANWPEMQPLEVAYGSTGFDGLMHEIGHALGLSHPGTYDASDDKSPTYADDAEYAQDNRQYSIMSYFGILDDSGHWTQDGGRVGWGFPQTPMVHDIAAIQSKYGADLTTRTGDTTYGFNSTAGEIYLFRPKPGSASTLFPPFPVFTIYDAGGVDTLDASQFADIQRIDLTPGAYSNIGGAVGNIGIAFDIFSGSAGWIENAIGGSLHDDIIGNGADNRLDGDAGDDRLEGHAGNDRLIGGTGIDSLDGGIGDDQLQGDSGNDALAGHFGNDRLDGGIGDDFLDGGADDDELLGGGDNDLLHGSSQNDTLNGGAGDDFLDPGTGADLVTGGTGIDTFIYGKGYGQDRFVDFGSADRLNLETTSVHSFGALLSHAAQVGADTVFDFGNGDRLTLAGVDIDDLDPDGITFSPTPARGGDFLVAQNHARGTSVAGLDDGGFVAVWTDNRFENGIGIDGSGLGIVGRIYNEDGSFRRDLVINSTATGNQAQAVVTRLEDGRFVVVWRSEDGLGGVPGSLRARLFEADGDAIGNDFVVNGTPNRTEYAAIGLNLGEPDVAALPDGGFIVAWRHADIRDPFEPVVTLVDNVHARLFTADAVPRGGDIVVNFRDSHSFEDYGSPAVEALADGEILVTWIESPGGLVQGRFLDEVHDFPVQSNPASLVAYPGTEIVRVNDGMMLVMWTTEGRAWGRLITAGALIGEEFLINDPSDGDPGRPTATPLGDDRVLVVWHSTDEDGGILQGTGDGFHSRIFDFSDLGAIWATPDVILNGVTEGHAHFLPTVTALADGRAAIAWTDSYPNDFPPSGTSFAHAVRAIILNSDGSGVTLAGTPGDDTLVGSGYDDRISGLAGNDLLVGRAGPDLLDGGEGVDTVSYDISLQPVIVSLANPLPEGGGDAQGDVLVGIENVIGSAYDDDITGDGGANTISGGYGDDIIAGGAGPGRDELHGNAGRDHITLSAPGRAFGDKGDDTLEAGASGAGEFFGGDGSDLLRASGFDRNSFFGGEDRDTLSVRGGSDNLLSGDAGDDLMFVSQGGSHNILQGGAGKDILDGELATGDDNEFRGERGRRHDRRRQRARPHLWRRRRR